MPDILWNYQVWNDEYSWPEDGNEWSKEWGDERSQWYGLLLPRLFAFLPVGTILEIGCGHGRWSKFLNSNCNNLILVDLSERCLEYCSQKFVKDQNIQYLKTNGLNLKGIADNSVDLIFSFDSLVHAEIDVIGSYLKEIKRILKDTGTVVIHHSNRNEYCRTYKYKVLSFAGTLLKRIKITDHFWKKYTKQHDRASSVSADIVRTLSVLEGMNCVRQEIFPWDRSGFYCDCISVIIKDMNPSYRKFYNHRFLQERNVVLSNYNHYRI